MVRDHIRVRVNGVMHEARVPPATTLLEWLRRERRLTGSKEGCAEGDCGACTVLVARARAGEVRFRAVNACILLMPMLDGASVTTVEGLAAVENGGLSVVQSEMVSKHGSQCGFCTPGFVMSMFADRMERVPLAVDDVLAGNLCRCTGYGPIVAAMEAARMTELSATEVAWRAREVAAVMEMVRADDARVEGDGAVGLVAGSLARALDFMGEGGATTVVGGATDVGLWITKQQRELPRMLFLDRVSELQTVETVGDVLRIGGGVTYTEAADVLCGAVPAFGALLMRIGGVQVRNSGTIGGNIANGSPIGDMPPCLIALGARVGLRSANGERVMPLEDFFISYGKNARGADELLVRIDVPIPAAHSLVRFYKVSKRADSDITSVLGAFHLTFNGGLVEQARIAFGGMAGVPARAIRLETALVGRPFNMATVADAASELDADFQPISDLRAAAGYRRAVARNLLHRLVAEYEGTAAVAQLSDLQNVSE